MRFLSPGFLFALLTIIIPVIIHLFNFRKFKKVYFSNVRFLKAVEIQTSSSQHLKNKLILACRILAISFMVFAFARPYIPDAREENLARDQAISVFVDNSFSMEAVNQDGTLLDEAKRRAKEIASAYSLNDRFQLLTNDFEGRSQRLINSEEFLNTVEEIPIGAAQRNFNQIIARQQEAFTGEPNARKTIYIISDFQQNILPQTVVKPDSSVHVRLVRLKAHLQSNISIDSVWFASAIHRPGDAEKLIIKLRNNSDQEARSIPVRVNINKRQKALGNINIAARASSIDTLSFSGLTAGWQEGEIVITDFPVVFDDEFYFSFNVRESLPILIINDSGENEYLNSVFRSDEFFKVVNVSSGRINYSQLNSYPLIILNEPNQISAGLIDLLKSYVERGGSVMLFPALNKDQTSLVNLLRSLYTDVPIEVVDAETKVTAINLQHPLFKGVFERIPQKMDLPVVKKFIRYSSLNNTSRQEILSFPGQTSFLSEYLLGSGKIYLSATPLRAETSNFARHSLFVPIMYQIALSSLRDQDLFYKLNRDQVIELPKLSLRADQILKLKQEDFEAIPDLRQNGNTSQLYIADQIKQAGNYQLLKNDSLLALVSFNDTGSESDLTYATDAEIKSKFAGRNVDIINSERGSIEGEIQSIDRGTSLWKLCIVLSLLFLAAEIMLIRFYNKPLINL